VSFLKKNNIKTYPN